MIKYVLGLMFSDDRQFVVLMKKMAKPDAPDLDWQAGLLNGIGGKIEDETRLAAMIREFKQETGVTQSAWKQFATMWGEEWLVECFVCFVEEKQLFSVKTQEDEEVLVIPVEELIKGQTAPIIPNLKWLIPMALDADNIIFDVHYKD